MSLHHVASMEARSPSGANVGAGADVHTVLFCGYCRHEQLPSGGKACEVCGRFVVKWDKDHESEYLARKRWRRWYGE